MLSPMSNGDMAAGLRGELACTPKRSEKEKQAFEHG